MTDSISMFPCGLRVFLRTQNAQGDLHFVDLPTARKFISMDEQILSIINDSGTLVGSFVITAISFILPLDPVVPLAKN